jgi:hypothetical protein
LPPIGAISKNPGVSADPVAKPATHTREESRVLGLCKRLRERDGLSTGGSRIRTLSPTRGSGSLSGITYPDTEGHVVADERSTGDLKTERFKHGREQAGVFETITATAGTDQ